MASNLIGRVMSILKMLFPSADDTFNSGDFLYSFGKASEAIFYSILFMPDLVLVSDSVLLEWGISAPENMKRFLSKIEKTDVNLPELEASFNFIEIGYLFDVKGRDTNDEQDTVLAEVLAQSWRGYLAKQYPERSFVVDVLLPEETGSTVGLHFYQKR